MTRALFLLLLLWPLALRADWPGIEYSEVRAFASKRRSHNPRFLIHASELSSSSRKSGVLLTPEQVKRLIAAVTGEHPQHFRASCFFPRHAFVFYDSAHTPCAWVEVCFECMKTRGMPEGTAHYVDIPALAELCDELRLRLSPGKGYRKLLRICTVL